MLKINKFAQNTGRMLVIFGITAAACGAAWAQSGGPGGPPPGGEMRSGPHAPSVEQELKHLTKLLNLSAEQQTQIKAILTDQHQQIEALLNSTKSADGQAQPPSREAMEENRAAMDSIHEATRTAIAAVLDDEQKAKFAEWESKHKRPDRQSQSGEMPPSPPSGEGGSAGF